VIFKAQSTRAYLYLKLHELMQRVANPIFLNRNTLRANGVVYHYNTFYMITLSVNFDTRLQVAKSTQIYKYNCL